MSLDENRNKKKGKERKEDKTGKKSFRTEKEGKHRDVRKKN